MGHDIWCLFPQAQSSSNLAGLSLALFPDYPATRPDHPTRPPDPTTRPPDRRNSKFQTTKDIGCVCQFKLDFDGGNTT